jgi:hypothetical protein
MAPANDVTGQPNGINATAAHDNRPAVPAEAEPTIRSSEADHSQPIMRSSIKRFGQV